MSRNIKVYGRRTGIQKDAEKDRRQADDETEELGRPINHKN